MSPKPRSKLCEPHRRRFRREPGGTLEQFLADPQLRPLLALGPCRVAACSLRAESEYGYCPTHYVRWRTTVRATPDTDERHWQLTQPAISQGGQVSLRGLPCWSCARCCSVSSSALPTARRSSTCPCGRSATRCAPSRSHGWPCARPSVSAAASRLGCCWLRWSQRSPGADRPELERAGDSWDLALFGHRGRLSFSGISQPWLAEAAKVWAGEEPPRHRGGGASNVRGTVNALAALSESLRVRDDQGQAPERLGRPDIEAFLNRLGYLESTGVISRYHRNVICRVPAPPCPGSRAGPDPAGPGRGRAAWRLRGRAGRYPRRGAAR